MDAFVIERDSVVLGPDGLLNGYKDLTGSVPTGSCVWDGYQHKGYSGITRGQPTHYGGATIHCSNGEQQNVTITMQASDDGTSWTTLTFSDQNNSSLITFTIAGLSEHAFVVQSSRRYLRITSTPASGSFANDGVRVDLIQHPPRGIEQEASITS